VAGGDDGWNDDDENQNDDAGDEAHSHLHVLPPHLFADSVRAASEALRGNSKVVCLVLKSVKPLASLGDFVDVVSHNAHRVINLGLQGLCSGVTSSLCWRGLAARDVRVIWGFLRHLGRVINEVKMSGPNKEIGSRSVKEI